MKVLPIHCHQRLEENTLVESIEGDIILLNFKDKNLDFFYDHEIDHIPGMLEICALRQCALALAHLVYEVPMDYEIVLNWLNVNLCNYGKLDKTTTVKYTLLEQKRNKNTVILEMEGHMFQDDKLLVSMTGKLMALNQKLKKRINATV